MKKLLKKFLIILLSIALFNIINNNYTFAVEEIASGSCGNSITWSLDSDGKLTINGSGNMSGSACAWADYAEKVKSVEFIGNITSISNCAFEFNSNIETIVLPDNVSSIGRRAFAECINLKSITTPKNLVSIGISAFYKCTSLENIDLSERLLYIRNCAFAECSSLKSITVKAIYISIGDDPLTISDTAQIYGYKDSSIFYYARYYGRTFTDLNTNETTTANITNQSFLDSLPTEDLVALGPTSHGGSSWGNNTLSGFTTSFCYENDVTNEKYLEIKSKVEEITKDCTTETEKARAILNWAVRNIKYEYVGARADIDILYSIWERKNGNCESYTLLTNYMLYLCGIPTGTASNMTHAWSVAYVDGKWINVDSTQGYFGSTPNKINQLSFAYDGVVYVITDPLEGGKIAGIAKTSDEIEKLTTFTIPTNSYTIGIYETALPSKIELRADINSIGAQYIKENRRYCRIENNQIIGTDEDIEINYTTINTTTVDGKQVMILKNGQKISNFLTSSNFPVIDKGYNIDVYDQDNNKKDNSKQIGSKNIIKISNAGNNLIEYMVILKGDVNGDGQAKMYDSFQILKETLFGANLNKIDILIRDYNDDGKVKMYDAFSFLKYTLFN